MSYRLHRDPRSSHQRIARYVKTLGRDPILDVGASNGQIAQLLDGNGFTIDAIGRREAENPRCLDGR